MNNPTQEQIQAAAAAIANARGMRRGVPKVVNILAMLPPDLVVEVTEDAAEALKAAFNADLSPFADSNTELDNKVWVGSMVSGRTEEPLVELSFADRTLQLRPAEARSIALQLLQGAEAALGDALLLKFLAHISDDPSGVDPDIRLGALGTWRELRDQVDPQ